MREAIDDPLNAEAQKSMDPFSFRERMTMTKINTQSMGDEFFCLDDSHYWLTEMKGPIITRLLPDAKHTRALSGLSIKDWVS